MDNLRSMLPSERAEAKTEEEARLKELGLRRIAALREDFGRTFQTEHGKRVLAWIWERSGYSKSKVSASKVNGSVDKDMTAFLAQEETFYLEIRKHISIEVLKQVEYGQISPAGTIVDIAAPTKKKKVKRK